MEQTDRQTDKTSRWAFTAFEEEWPLFKNMNEVIAEWGWQTEVCPKTQKPHYQGYLRTKRQVRFAQLKKILPGVHIESAKNWDALVNYCKKTDSAQEGSQVHQVSTTKAMTMAVALTKLATFADNDPPTDYCEPEWEKRYERYIKVEYWKAVRKILTEDPDEVGLWTQPQYMRAWENTRSVWIKKAAIEYNNANGSEVKEQEGQEVCRDEGGEVLPGTDSSTESKETCEWNSGEEVCE